MNYYTVYDLEKFVNRHTHGVGVSQASDFFGSIDDGRVSMLKKIRPPEIVRKMFMEQALYDQVDRYAVPDDLKYEDVIEIKKLPDDRNVDTMTHPLEIVYRRRFDQKRHGARNVMAIFNENGLKYAKIHNPRGLRKWTHLVINDVDSLNANGTWNVGGNVVDLRIDKLNHITKHASLQFDFNNSTTTGFIENFTMESVDLYDFIETGSVFAWLSVSLPQQLLSVRLTLGSNSSNLATDLYQFTVNQPHDSNEFTTDWNLLKFPIRDMSTVGNPNPKAITYIRLDFVTTGQAIPNCNIDNIVARKGVVYELTYNGRFIIMDAQTKAFKKKSTAGSDLIIAEEDTWNIFALEVSLAVQKEIYGNGVGSKQDVTDIENDLKEAYYLYRMEHPSEALLQQDSSYVFGNMYDGLTDEPIGDWENPALQDWND